MPATLSEPVKLSRSEVIAPNVPVIVAPPLEPFAWEEQALSGDLFGFRVWLIGFGVLGCLAVLDWVAALLG